MFTRRRCTRGAAFSALDVHRFGMPVVVVAERLLGVEKSSHREQNRVRLERFASAARVLRFDRAARYATVRTELAGTAQDRFRFGSRMQRP